MIATPQIHESFKIQPPPPWMRATVERLLGSLNRAHLAGFAAVVLTDSAAVGKGKPHRVGKRKFHARECRGFYHAATRTQGAWIELVADDIIPPSLSQSFQLTIMRDLRVGETLYHEVGHHIDATVGSATRGGEAAAEDWARRLSRIHFRKKYWYLRPFISPLRWVVRAFRDERKKRSVT